MPVDLFSYSPLAASYSSIYGSLSQMRELFHQTGRFDDSNAKLDEVTKLFATYLAYRRGWIAEFPVRSSSADLIEGLESSFAQAAQVPNYTNHDGSSLFGKNPSLSLRRGDEPLVQSLVDLVRAAVDTAIANRELKQPFDVLNEAFGHFVRDNFRSNTEDAQYLTPPEVVEFMVALAISRLEDQLRRKSLTPPLLILDPCCGVASFLTSFYRQARLCPALSDIAILLHGQDKVERMTRLSALNLALFEVASHKVSLGNSLEKGSVLDALDEKVDIILTNPPFGAKFASTAIASAGPSLFPILASPVLASSSLDSELLFIDRSLSLLRPGGLLLIIVPDSVISARGAPAVFRRQLADRAAVRAVVGLPNVTFAQAGTRTRTSILFLEKTPPDDYPVFIAEAGDLGFDVNSRKGAPIKVSEGTNELPAILDAYQTSGSSQLFLDPLVLSESPSSVLVPSRSFRHGAWTPAHYRASRFKAVSVLANSATTVPTPLHSLVSFQSAVRIPKRHSPGVLFISVLHVIGEGLTDVASLRAYSPKTPGFPVNPGEILLAKINPRIPRVLVVPSLPEPLLCSTEFEVMAPLPRADPYLIAYLLLTEQVQSQIQSLTSGTSASHNRIKTEDLSRVLIPWPKQGTDYAQFVHSLMNEYASTLERITTDTTRLLDLRAQELAARTQGHVPVAASEPQLSEVETAE